MNQCKNLDWFKGPQTKIKTLGPAAAGSEEGKQAHEMFDFVEADIRRYKEQQWLRWCSLVSENSEAQLKKQLVT